MGQNLIVITLNRLFYLKLFLIVLAIFAVRIWLINQFGSSVPYWDQWDAEALYTFIPWFDGNLTLNHLIAPHNEHRLFFTRILSLGLLLLNDTQWDPLVQMVFCAGLAILNVLAQALILKQLLGERGYNVTLFAVALFGLVPFAAENIIWGLQINWYLFNLFSLIAFWGVLLHKEATWRWWLGMICVFLTYFNLASGILLAVILLLVKSYQWLVDSKNREQYLLSLIVLAIFIGIEVLLFADSVGHAELRHQAAAHGFWNIFFPLLGKYLAFPLTTLPYMSIIMYLPIILLSLIVIFSRRNPNALEIFSLTLGGWIILQAAAIAYGRLWMDVVSFRYMDILALGTIANLLALYALYDLLPKGYNRLIQLYGVLWGIAWCAVPFLLMDQVVPFLQNKQLEKQEFIKNVRSFLATNDVEQLNHVLIPFPRSEQFASILAVPSIKKILPASLQMPPLVNAMQNDGIFIQNQTTPGVGKYQNEAVWGSAGIPVSGTFISEPITIKHSYLQIPLAGYLGTPGLQLQLLVEGQPPITITPPKVIGESWSSVYVRTPTEPFKIVATDQNINTWFAFGMPRGVGVLSFWTVKLLNYANYLMLGSLGLLLALIFSYSYLKPETMPKPVS